jgi:hypothetical protein
MGVYISTYTGWFLHTYIWVLYLGAGVLSIIWKTESPGKLWKGAHALCWSITLYPIYRCDYYTLIKKFNLILKTLYTHLKMPMTRCLQPHLISILRGGASA